jgi:hypothetical protein
MEFVPALFLGLSGAAFGWLGFLAATTDTVPEGVKQLNNPALTAALYRMLLPIYAPVFFLTAAVLISAAVIVGSLGLLRFEMSIKH